MTEEFISVKDRIISASIDIISDAGLMSLDTKNISRRTNITEAMLYRYYSNTDEILSDIIDYYFRFDSSIFSTLKSRDSSNIEKIYMYLDAYGSYYNSYYSLSAIMLQYEFLLHNTVVREKVVNGYLTRRNFLVGIFKSAIEEKEIADTFTPEQLADIIMGLVQVNTLNRRMVNYKNSLKEELKDIADKFLNDLLLK